ncbi:MAG: diguanylate cyclase [Actinobacteria bacterium]|nr:diguanylate cyclase [Actinomycetota bacterium]
MTDRCLVISIGAGLASLAAGVVALVLDAPEIGLVAGILGFLGAVAATAIAARARVAELALHETTVDRARLRRELDALAAIFAEEATRRAGPASDDALPQTELAVDPESGLLDQKFFTVLVQQRVAAARRALQPVSVVVFELDGVGRADASTKRQAIGVLGEVIRRTLRECDAACRIGETMAAAVLEDTAEAGAVWAAERVRGTLHACPVGDSLTVSAGIACYPSHALEAPRLVQRAGHALKTARANGRDHVEIAQAE